MKVYGIVLAGGCGTRFWPMSRQSMPKQLLNLSGKDSLINETLSRLEKFIARENIFIITNGKLLERLRLIIKDKIPSKNVLCEPMARNTAACIGYAAFYLRKHYGDGVMIVTPSDAYIHNTNALVKTLQTAVKAASETDALVTVGITPTFAATGYGYIRQSVCNDAVKPVLQFIEKPDRTTAEYYFQSGKYLWNSGMVVCRTSIILQKYKELLPDIYEELCRLSEYFGTECEREMTEKIYSSLRAISIDYGIMEKAKDILSVSCDCGWSDVGSWEALGALHSADERGNVCVGDVVAESADDCVLYSSGRMLAVLGVDNLVVVETPDAVMVCRKDKTQDVKKLVEELKKRGKEGVL